MLKKGFYTAVGTPLDGDNNIIAGSLKKQIEDQIAAGASGVLLYGTMGMGGCVKDSQYAVGIEAAVEAIAGRCALLVGASENSLARVKDKFEIMNSFDGIDGIVMTTPYYFAAGESSLINFFKTTAAMTKKDYYMYDIVPVTKLKITYGMMQKLKDIPNLKGIKSGDPVLIKKLTNTPLKDDFAPIFSNSDLFEVGYTYGITRYLDGIFSCMPKTVKRVQDGFNSGDFDGAKKALMEMMDTRDIMLGVGIWPAFTYAMNSLGYEGNFAPDYEVDIDAAAKKIVKKALKTLGEL